MNNSRIAQGLTAAALIFCSTACMVGPNYKRPAAPAPAAFKEPPPAGWKEASPSDTVIRSHWWEMYNDPQLNELEAQVSINNQNVLAAEATFRQERAIVRVARANLYPTVGISPSFSSSRSGLSVGNLPNGTAISTPIRETYSVPGEFSWQLDIFGAIRRSIHQAADLAQASAAQYENARLLYQSDLAADYFEMHGLDGDIELLERTTASYRDYLKLTQDRFASGVASGADVAQAETQIYNAQATLVDLGVQRAQYEHAIAVLIGKAPSEIELPRASLKNIPPEIPVALPSVLLERRPDIAALERQVAAANEQLGVIQAAYYPTLSLSVSGGLESLSFSKLFTAASRFWSLGPTFSQTFYEGGRRGAQVAEYQAAYDVTVANYRQTVLTAFQQVEDNLVALRVLEQESGVEAAAVKAAQTALSISTYQYKAGVADYLQVITNQTFAYQSERAAVDLLTRRMTASVALIQALGGGWNSNELPATRQLTSMR